MGWSFFDGQRVPVSLSELTDGKSVMVYGQTEVTRDLMAARAASDAPIVYGVSEVTIHDAKVTGRRSPILAKVNSAARV